MSLAIVRFLVGQDEEKSIVRLNQKLHANLRPDPAGRVAAAGEAALHRRRADPRADALEQALRRFRAAPDRRAGARRDQADAGRLGGHADRRPAARSPHHARPGAAGGVQSLAAAGRRRARRSRTGACRPGEFAQRQPASTCWRPASSCAPPTMSATWWSGVANDKPVFVRDVAEVADGGEEPSQYVRIARDGDGIPTRR